ncbi:GAF domain-containing protein [Roseospira marina]|uniref:histidine kinase n=1 Tax=Roseospira marina TaxID=140057 RepID=A0A5M6IAI8_9PROT|nr:ATP-binding protein [Roseospira marina]KAA5605280.1 GAF domain-containing protein [Roseospira marina]MBB4314741.1 light-regulated signal transduction histidine kinase (bacteriophytochrome) [Roseospira marina]MBB5087730.1 light-regulated signal transduction histidine kinase (bacteriophytochrome) [Roseospira marina]
MTQRPTDGFPDLPTVDLSECENEPIHLLERVQGHGCVLVLLGPSLRITQASQNTDPFLGHPCEAVLGQSIRGLLDDLAVMVLTDLMASRGGHRVGGAPVGFYARSPMPGLKGKRLRGTAHRLARAGEPCVLVELEASSDTDEEDAERTFEAEGFAIAALTEGENLYRLLDQAVSAVAGLTDYDRVMAYMFHPDWSGEVVAESRVPDLTPFLGLRYPASDIPAQARRLYLTNRLRVIADVHGAPAPMARSTEAVDPDTGPLDLSPAVLRSVSSYHIEYLRNMGVGATLVTSLVVDGALWGLIACHNMRPKTMPWHRREAVDRLTERIANRISDILSLQRTRQARRNARFMDLARRAPEESGRHLLDRLFFGAPRLADVLRCDGLVVHAPGRTATTGNTPPLALMATVLERAAAQAEAGVFACHDLAESGLFDDLGPLGCCGALVGVVSRTPLIALACFRDEVVHEVHWGGDPNKPVEVDSASNRVSPRKSFNLWRQTVLDQSRPWEAWSLDLMRGLTEILAETLARESQDGTTGTAAMNTAIEDLATDFERRASAMVEGLDLADNGALLAAPAPNRSPGVGASDHEIALLSNTAFCNRFDVDAADIAGRRVVDVLTALGLPASIANLPQGGTLEVEWWSGDAGHRTLQIVRRGLFAVARDGVARSWVVFTFDDVTSVYRTQRALGVARNQALARSRGRTEFLAHLARDLRAPLHAIQGFAGSLESGDAPDTPGLHDRYREYAGEIRAMSGGLLDLLNELLDVARLEGVGEMASSSVFDLTLLVGEVCQGLRNSGRGADIAWDWHLPNERILIQGDASALRNALWTLINAALRASPPDGSVMVRLTMERGGEPRISVSDTGLGLGEDDLMALQRPLDAALTHGTGVLEPRRGLGLALARGLIDLHGGGLSVTTNPGSGTTVHVSLPRHRVVDRDNTGDAPVNRPKGE